MITVFKALVRGVMRDRISLFWAVLVPVVVYACLGLAYRDLSHRRQLLIGSVAMGSLFFSLFGVAFEVLSQRNRGVYMILKATSFPIRRFVLALTGARLAIALVSGTVVYVACSIIGKVEIDVVRMLAMLPVFALGSLVFALLGFVTANLANNETQLSMLANAICLPMLFGSEAFYRLDFAPEWTGQVSRGLPLSHMVDGLRAAMAGDYAHGWWSCLVLAGFALFITAVSVATFRHKASG